MTEKIRINRFLAGAGVDSRRKCEELIKAGRVKINGKIITELGARVDPNSDSVLFDGKEVIPRSNRIILVLNKPPGIISSASDEFGRTTVVDIARSKGFEQRVYPVGRLDIDTTGIILLTDDGEFANRMTHPRFKVAKRYIAVVQGDVSAETARKIASGVDIGGYTTKPCTVRVLSRSDETTELEIVIAEGKKRQVRKMFDAFGHRVMELERTSIGGINFDDIAVGDIRPLREDEEKALREQIGLL